eukprot:gnl/Hemi2/5054_TR1755_c0_g1_i1.p3 gnl/Hemi2/5054_TR1755_c0_g1~~gnl/Hemi2/5054_TR1755_c0_g1_i1.p3  ORF type:complete len:193 (+),score=71.87 gnl/Hemi2/5054_TR1755_c0_g1_i1:58-579(+)
MEEEVNTELRSHLLLALSLFNAQDQLGGFLLIDPCPIPDWDSLDDEDKLDFVTAISKTSLPDIIAAVRVAVQTDGRVLLGGTAVIFDNVTVGFQRPEREAGRHLCFTKRPAGLWRIWDPVVCEHEHERWLQDGAELHAEQMAAACARGTAGAALVDPADVEMDEVGRLQQLVA